MREEEESRKKIGNEKLELGKLLSHRILLSFLELKQTEKFS